MNSQRIVTLLVFLFSVCALFAQKAVLRGVVQDEMGQPIEHTIVQVLDRNIQTITNDYGQFTMDVPSGVELRVYFQQISHRDTVILLTMKANENRNIQVLMPAIGNRLEQVNIRSGSDNGYIRVNPRLSVQMPSPTGGMESLIKMLPGTSSTNELSSQYNVRGGNYDENLVFINDIQIYRPFLVRSAQQEGMSVVNTDLTGNVIFSAGGFEAKYGDKMSSVLDVQYKEPTCYGGSFSASMLGATAHAEGKVDSTFSFLIGARFKSNAYLLKSLQTKGDYKPVFFDIQMLLNWDITPKFSISLLGNLTRNKYLYVPETRETNFGNISSMRRLTIYFDGQELDRYENYLGGFTFNYKPNENNALKLILSTYFANESESYDIQSQYFLSDIEADLGNEDGEYAQETSVRAYGTYFEHARNRIKSLVSAADLRGEHKLPYHNTLTWGIKAQNEIISDHISEWQMFDSTGYTLPMIPTIPGDSVPLDDPSRLLDFGENSSLISSNQLNTFRFTAFIQDIWKIKGDDSKYILSAGMRAHYWTYTPKEFTVSPRLAFTFNPHWRRDWLFNVKTGLYYQPAFYREMRYPNGTLNPDIRSQRSYQVIAGTEYNFKIWRRPFKFTAEAYYKYLDHLISYQVDNVRIIYSGTNDAVGYATGLDLKISGEFIRGLESWLSMSLMRTAEDIIGDSYIDDEGQTIEPGYIPRPTDQRVSFNLFFQDHIPGYPQFRVHLNLVFASGLPYGPPEAEAYQRTFRTSWYRRVDMGFSFMFLEQSRDRMRNKSRFIRSIKNAGLYIEVFNLLGTNNVSSYFWITDIGNRPLGVPNYLTGRLVNVKFAVEF